MSTNPFGDNPYQGPNNPGVGGGPGYIDPGMARSKVQGPAIALIVVGGLGILIGLANIGFSVLGMGVQAANQPDAQFQLMAQGVGGIIQGIVGLVFSALVIFGSIQMMNLKNYGLSFASAIIAMIPCLSPCCLIGLPVGIWALVVLNDPNVKNSFTK